VANCKHDFILCVGEHGLEWRCSKCWAKKRTTEFRRRYDQSPKGRATQVRYEQSEKGRVAHSRYDKSPARAEARARYKQSAKGKATQARYRRSPEGKAARVRYKQSERGKATTKAITLRWLTSIGRMPMPQPVYETELDRLIAEQARDARTFQIKSGPEFLDLFPVVDGAVVAPIRRRTREVEVSHLQFS
jgi:hypothetical protein